MIRLRLKKHVTLEDGLHIKVSQRFTFNDFGVRGKDAVTEANRLCQSGRFICSGEPGTGFFERDSESESYMQFVSEYSRKMKPSIWQYIFGKDFSYDREIEAVNTAMAHADKLQRAVLESYGNCLLIAKEADYLQRMVNGVKAKMGNRPTKRYTSAISHIRSRIHAMAHEMSSCRLNVDQLVSGEIMEHYRDFCKEFMATANSHRIWSLCEKSELILMNRVFWDVGVFDYIRSPHDTPLMRDANGVWYYIFPTHIIRTRTSIDFDVLPLKDLHVEYRETSGEALTSTKASLDYMYGRTLGEVYFNELNLSFFFAHRSVAHRFKKAWCTYWETL